MSKVGKWLAIGSLITSTMLTTSAFAATHHKHHKNPKAYVAAGLGWQTIHTNSPGYCVGIAGGVTYAGATVRQGKCNYAPDQLWLFSGAYGSFGNPYWTIQNFKSHLCVDFRYNVFTNGSQIIQYYCNSNDQAQQLGFNATTQSSAKTAPYAVHHWSIYSQYCMAVPGGHYQVAVDLVQWQCPAAYNNSPPANFQFWNSPGG